MTLLMKRAGSSNRPEGLSVAESEASWRDPLDELIRVGPFKLNMRLPTQLTNPRARLLVSDAAVRVSVSSGTARMEIQSILDHEVIVLE